MTISAETESLLADADFPALCDYIISATGLVFYVHSTHALAQRLTDRLAEVGLNDCASYLDRLRAEEGGAAELDALAARLTVGETFFFRHQELFEALRLRVLPEIIERNQGVRRLRIWSAGCAVGAEPYSLAILLEREFQTQLAGWETTIVATDINRDFLAQAERGEFSDWVLRAVPENIKQACFTRHAGSWLLGEEFRRRVTFQYHNLAQHPFPSLFNGLSAFDLILCRNVMIYFGPAMIRRLAEQFHESLVEGGWFVVGPIEPSVETYRAFETVNWNDVVLYRKSQTARLAEPPTVPFTARSVALRLGGPAEIHRAAGAAALGRQASFQALRSPAAVTQGGTATVAVALADARARLNRGDLAQAAEACQKLLACERLNPQVHFFHALVMELEGEGARADQALRKAIYLDRRFVLAHYHLGLRAQRSHDFTAARRSYRNVLELLAERDTTETFVDADGLTVGDLRELTHMQCEVLDRS